MFNSKLKLQGLSLEEIIHEGVMGNTTEVSVDDWKFIESLVAERMTPEEIAKEISDQLDDTADCNYRQGLSDGGADEREITRLRELLEENDIEY